MPDYGQRSGPGTHFFTADPMEPRSDLLVPHIDHFPITTDAVTVLLPSQIALRGAGEVEMSGLSA
jgi:hypothetical protein